MFQRIIIIILLICRFLAASFGISAGQDRDTDVSAQLCAVLEYLRESAADADDISKLGEWTVIALRTGGMPDSGLNDRYLAYITEKVRAEAPGKSPLGALDEHKPTENARIVLALSAIGADPADIGGYDLTAPLCDVDWVCSGTVNGPVFALLALNASGAGDADTRNKLADYILECRLSDGGWALSGKRADPDVTAMALQALAVCSDRPDVVSAAHSAIDALARLQHENGGYLSYGRENSESASQVIIALCAWGIDPRTDSRFIRNGRSLFDVLMEYRAPDGGFCDVPEQGTSPSRMASEQAALALAALEKLGQGGGALYSFVK